MRFPFFFFNDNIDNKNNIEKRYMRFPFFLF